MKLKIIFKKEMEMETNFLRPFLSKEGLKTTKQREEILHVFLNSPGHRNLSQIYAQVAKANPKIGFATVYRTLKLLTRLGLATERTFADGETRYEKTADGGHHDHLICLDCGKIIEFEDQGLETLQDGIAHQYRFKVSHHRMELYGQCLVCSRKKVSKRKR